MTPKAQALLAEIDNEWPHVFTTDGWWQNITVLRMAEAKKPVDERRSDLPQTHDELEAALAELSAIKRVEQIGRDERWWPIRQAEPVKVKAKQGSFLDG